MVNSTRKACRLSSVPPASHDTFVRVDGGVDGARQKRLEPLSRQGTFRGSTPPSISGFVLEMPAADPARMSQALSGTPDPVSMQFN